MPSYSRRQVLAMTATAGIGLAGCLSAETVDTELGTVEGNWAVAGQNAAHTRAVGGTFDEPETVWTVDLPDARATSTPSLRDGTLYAPANATDRHAHYRHQLYALSAETGELRWYVPLRSQMNSSPAVGAGRVVVTGRRSTERGRVVAFDHDTGREEWLHDTDARLTAPPTIDGLDVYVADWGGTVRAFNVADGTLRWSIKLGDDGWAVAEPVAVHDDSLYLSTLTSSGRVFALDADTGEERWSVSTDVVNAGPVVTDEIVAVWSHTGVEAFDTEGDHRFTFAIPDDRGAQKLAVGNHHLYATGRDTLYAIDRGGEKAWTYEGTESLGPPTVVGEEVLVHDDGEVVALSITHGAVQWRTDTDGSGDVIAAEDALFLTASNGRLTALGE